MSTPDAVPTEQPIPPPAEPASSDNAHSGANGAASHDEPSLAGSGPAIARFDYWERSHPKELIDRRTNGPAESTYAEKRLSIVLTPGSKQKLFGAYVTPARRRLGRDPIGAGTTAVMRLLVARIHDPEGEKDAYKRVVKSREKWFDESLLRFDHLISELHPCAWSDPAGLTLLWTLPQPFVVATAADATRWAEFYFSVRKLVSTKYKLTIDADGGGFDALFDAPAVDPVGDRTDVPVFAAVPFPPAGSAPKASNGASARRAAPRPKASNGAHRAAIDLTAITRAAHDRGRKDGERAPNVLADASAKMPETVCWTTYDGDRHRTHGGERQERTFQAFGDSLAAYAKRAAPKGSRWFMGATSRNGRCRDEDVEAIYLVTLDCDGKGGWTRLRAAFDEAGIAYVVQRSSSHRPEVPKWHASVALAAPWSGPKRHWRVTWRWIIGYLAAVADLLVEWDRTITDPETGAARSAPLFGFDHSTDRLGQPIFPAAKRDSTCEAPETVITTGRALDLDELLTSTGFDRAWLNGNDEYEPTDATRVDPAEGLLARAFAEAGMLGPRIGSKGYTAECPNEHEHSEGTRFDTSTIIFDPGPGQAIGWFKCSHQHCTYLAGDAVLKMIDEAAVERAHKAWHAAARRVSDDGSRPLIQLGTELHASVDLAVAALRSDPDLYQRGGRLVHVIPISHEESQESVDASGLPTLVEGSPTIRDMPRSIVRMHLSRHARFERFDARAMEWVSCRPDTDLVDMVHDLGQWHEIRPLLQIVESPVLLADMSVLQEPGYHAATGLLYAPSVEFPKAPERPTLDDAQAAFKRLSYPYLDFPFATGEARLAPIAAAMSIACRHAIRGHVPGIMFDASAPGAGKTIVTDCISINVNGRECPRISYPVNGRFRETDEEEMSKILAGYADAGAAYFSFDNIPAGVPVGGGSLDKALTQREAEFRILGRTGNPRRRWRAVIMATANNPTFHDDGAARRWLQSRLEPNDEPDKRNPDAFREKDLLGYMRKHHPQLAIDLLTIPRAYLLAVRDDPSQRRTIAHWPSFERWCEIVPASIAWVTGCDLTAARVRADASPRTGYLATFLELWVELLGPEPMLARDVIHRLYDGIRPRMPAPPLENRERYVEMIEAMHGLCKPPPGNTQIDKDQLGYMLRRYRGRPAGDPPRKLVGDADRKGVTRWTVAVSTGGWGAAPDASGGDPCS